MTKLNGWKLSTALFALCAAMAIISPAQVFTSLAQFTGPNGVNPEYVSLVQGFDGNLYGTTVFGGKSLGTSNCNNYSEGCGTAFKITSTGALTTFYSFCSQNSGCGDGVFPVAGLVLATDSNFYGTTNEGGRNGGGTVFRISRSGALTTLYSFCGSHCGSAPVNPKAPLIQGNNGNFYGTTASGGHFNCNEILGCGTLFEVTPQGSLIEVYRFCAKANCPDGYVPYSGLVLGSDGNFYGTTTSGGANNAGTIFKVTPGSGLTTLYSFCAQPNCSDGASPFAGLIQGSDGNFYGTTVEGGNNASCGGGTSCGTVFKITPAGTLTTLYSFCSQPNCTDGYYPQAGLAEATDGNFYGTTEFGGSDLVDCTNLVGGCGTVFQITPSRKLTTLHSFSNSDGAYPTGGLLQATNGVLYGTTSEGGQLDCLDFSGNFCGTIYSLDMGLGPFVAFVHPVGKIGQTGGVLGQGFTGTTSVSLNGTPANFIVVSDTFIKATVPPGATTGYVTVTTPTGVLTSNVPFHVLP